MVCTPLPIGYQDPQGWATEGWWNIAAQTCETLLKGAVPSRFVYVHAVDYDRGLAAQREEEHAAALERIAGGKQAQVGWGSQIRSYVLQPYQLVKDLRSDFEVGNISAVLDGGEPLDELMESVLRWRRESANAK